MAILPTTHAQNALSLQSATNTLKLSTGQSLTLNVQKIEGNQVQFALAGKTFTATTPSPLQGNPQQLNVTVTQTSPNVILQIQQKSPDSGLQKLETLQTAYKQLLPNQINTQQGIDQLLQFSRSPLLPVSIQSHITQLLEQLFKPNQNLSAKAFTLVLSNSGIFLENKLSKGVISSQDFKANLYQLLQLVSRQSTSEVPEKQTLLKTVLQMLNRITVKQLNNIEHPHLINIDIPLNPESSIEEISIDIRKKTLGHKKQWEVILDLKINNNTLITKLSLMDETLSAILWSDSMTLESYIKSHLSDLKMLFETSGISIKQLLISKQRPAESPDTQKVALIDIHI